MRKAVFVLLLSCSLLVSLSPPPLTAQSARPADVLAIDYPKEVKPLLAQHCYACHGPEAQQSGLRLDLRQNALRGGDYGPVIIPGNSAESRLIRRLVDGDGGMRMPPTGPLSGDEIDLLRRWIDQGAEFSTDVAAEAPPRPVDPTLAALVAAVRTGPPERVAPLLAAKPDLVNATDPAGSSLLHHAAGFGATATLTLLLDADANVTASNRLRSTPLHWAIADDAKVRLLVARGASVNDRQIEGRTPLYQAASLGDGLLTVRFLLEKGADPNRALDNGRTPLMAAAVRGDVDVMRALLDAGATVDATNGAGETALILAAGDGNPDAVRLLLQRRADPRARTKRSETALGNAATTGQVATVAMLLEHGADANVPNIRGYSPLMLAAASDAISAETIALLLARGAETGRTADYDESARDMAAKRGNTAVARLLGGLPHPDAPAAVTSHSPAAPRRALPDAVGRALEMTRAQSVTFIRTAGCNSCHSQDLPSAAAGFARSRGLPAPTDIPQLPPSMMPSPERLMDLSFVNVAGLSWELVDYGMNQVPGNAYTDAVVRAIKAMQTPAGHWSANESRRPPMNAGDFQAAAVCIYALTHYTPRGGEATTAAAIARAVAWLERATPQTTQDRAFHALALAWASSASAARQSAKALVAMQRADGGWSQLPDLPSDAYATGQALFALAVAGGMPATHPVSKRGVRYLLETQAADGTWHVKSRAIWLQPYFESGFPYGRDQFISTAGTAWASLALAATVPARRPGS